VSGCGEPGGIVVLSDRVSGFEDVAGELFAGPIGMVFDRILAAPGVAIGRESIYLAAVVQCRSPRGRIPLPSEVAACRERLWLELGFAEPQIVVACGRRSVDALFPDREQRPEAGSWLDWAVGDREVPVFTTLHPREAMAGPEGEVRRRKRVMYAHWQAISARFSAMAGQIPVDPA